MLLCSKNKLKISYSHSKILLSNLMDLEDVDIVFLCCQIYTLLKYPLPYGLYTQIRNKTGQHKCLFTLKYEDPKL